MSSLFKSVTYLSVHIIIQISHKQLKPFIVFTKVSEIDAEYFPPKEEVILQNEAPTDLYILVSGAVVLISNIDGQEQVSHSYMHVLFSRITIKFEVISDCKCSTQVVGKANSGDTLGEIGVLCQRPQPYTVRTTELSQILRLRRNSLMTTIQTNKEDEQIIMNNIFMVLKQLS